MYAELTGNRKSHRIKSLWDNKWQMVNAGFQPLQFIAEKTGKSIGQLKEEMSKGKITSEMVQQAFIDATSAGGKYYQMSEKASKTIGGQMSMLQDSLDLMFNDLGKGSQDAIMSAIQGATWLVEHYKELGGVLLTLISTFGIYKASMIAGQLAIKNSATDSSAAIIDGLNQQIAKMEEFKEQERLATYDSDLQSGVNNGTVDIATAAKVQAMREELRMKLEVAKQAKATADAEVESAKRGVEAATERVNKAQELMDASNQIGDADDKAAAAEELAAAKTELARKEDELATAQKNAKAAATEVDRVQTQANTISEMQSTAATKANTLSETANTTAKKGNIITTSLATAKNALYAVGAKAVAGVNHIVARSIDAIKVAWATNPLGLIITALTTVIGLFMTFRTKSDDVSEAVERFGEAAVKTKTNVDTLYAVLSSVNTNSKVYRDSLDELSKIAKDYGIVLDDEKNRYDQLIAKREQLIKLIMEEGRQRQIANNIEAFGKAKTEATNTFTTDIADTIAGDNKKLSDAQGKLFAQIIASDIELGRESFKPLFDDLRKFDQLYTRAIANSNVSAAEEYDRQWQQVRAKIIDEATKTAKATAANMGVTLNIENDHNKYLKLLGNYFKELEGYHQGVTRYTKEQEAVTRRISELKPAEKIDYATKDVKSLVAEMKNANSTIDEVNRNPLKPESDTSGIEKVADKAKKAEQSVKDINGATAKPIIDSQSIDITQFKLDKLKSTINEINGTETGQTINIDGKKYNLNATQAAIYKKLLSTGIVLANGNIDYLSLSAENRKVYESLVNDVKSTESNTNFKKAQDALAAIKAEFSKRLKNATTDNAIDQLLKDVKGQMGDIDRGSATYKYLDKLRKQIEAKKNSSKDDPRQRAYELEKSQRKEDERQMQLAKKTEGEKAQIAIDAMKEGAAKEVAQIRLDYKKKRDAIADEVAKEAKQLKENELNKWLKGGKDRKAYNFKASMTNDEYKAIAEQSLGAAERLKALTLEENKKLGEVYSQQLETMADFLRQYGTLEQQKLAITKAYEPKIAKAKSDGNELEATRLKREMQKELSNIDATKLLDESGFALAFDDLGIRLFSPMKDALAKLKEYTATDAFKQRDITDQQNIYNKITELENALTGGFKGFGLNNITKGVMEYTAALDDRLRAEESLKIATEELLKAEEELAKATGTDSEAAAKAARDKAIANEESAQGRLSRANAAVVAAQDKTRTSLNQFKTSLGQIDSAIRSLMSKGSLSGLWNLLGADFQKKVGMIMSGADDISNALGKLVESMPSGKNLGSLGKDIFNAISKSIGEGGASLGDAVNGSLTSVLSGVVNDDGTVKTLSKALGGKISDIMKQVSNGDLGENEAADKIGQLFQGIADAAGATGEMWGAIISLVLSLLDEFAQNGLGRFVNTLLTNIGSAIESIIGKLFTDFVPQLVEGVGNLVGGVLKGVGNLLTFGLFDGIGESDKTLAEDIDRLTRSNEALRDSIDALAEDLQDSKISDLPGIYQQQRQDLLDSQKNTAEMMRRSVVAYSNGFLGIGGSKSSAYKIDDNIRASDWAKVSQITGTSVRNAWDFFNLTSEQMAKVAKYAPEIYSQIKKYAAEGYKDASQYMDDYISYYKELEDLENKYHEQLTDVSFDGVRDEFKSLLLDMESDTDDFADSFEKKMQQAVVNTLMRDKYDEAIKDWYKGFVDAVESGGIDNSEMEKLRDYWKSITEEAVADREALKEIFGWDVSPSQQAASRSLSDMSQDTGDAIEGRVTAMQISVEAIRGANEAFLVGVDKLTASQYEMLAEARKTAISGESIDHNVALILMNTYDIADNTKAIVSPIKQMGDDITEMKKYLKNI